MCRRVPLCVSWLQLIEQRLGFNQVARGEPFGEPAVERGEEVARFRALP
jgi:hypothetical protein